MSFSNCPSHFATYVIIIYCFQLKKKSLPRKISSSFLCLDSLNQKCVQLSSGDFQDKHRVHTGCQVKYPGTKVHYKYKTNLYIITFTLYQMAINFPKNKLRIPSFENSQLLQPLYVATSYHFNAISSRLKHFLNRGWFLNQ